MKKPSRAFEPHLVVRELSVRPGGEWTPKLPGWTVVLIGSGNGYYLQPESNLELEAGTALLAGGDSPGTIRASHLCQLTFYSFTVMPTRLTGLLTLSEQNFFKAAADKRETSFQIFTPQHPMAARIAELCQNRSQGGLLFRLKLLEVFAEFFGNGVDLPAAEGMVSDARERLRVFLKEMPSSELLEMSFDELAQMTNCTSRHLSRIFRELVGKSFRDKRAELRLARARELLATGNSKVVDVALESGYQSLSLFNLMFSRRYGTSPGRWRQKYGLNLGKGKTAERPIPPATSFAIKKQAAVMV